MRYVTKVKPDENSVGVHPQPLVHYATPPPIHTHEARPKIVTNMDKIRNFRQPMSYQPQFCSLGHGQINETHPQESFYFELSMSHN
jgi:hypothetical protein